MTFSKQTVVNVAVFRLDAAHQNLADRFIIVISSLGLRFALKTRPSVVCFS